MDISLSLFNELIKIIVGNDADLEKKIRYFFSECAEEEKCQLKK